MLTEEVDFGVATVEDEPPMRVEITQERGYVRFAVAGAWAQPDESRTARERLRELGVWQPDGRVLLDLRAIDVASAPPYGAALRARLDDWRRLGPPPRIAVFATPGAVFGLARMLELSFGADPCAAFVHESEALLWLLRDDGV